MTEIDLAALLLKEKFKDVFNDEEIRQLRTFVQNQKAKVKIDS